MYKKVKIDRSSGEKNFVSTNEEFQEITFQAKDITKITDAGLSVIRTATLVAPEELRRGGYIEANDFIWKIVAASRGISGANTYTLTEVEDER